MLVTAVIAMSEGRRQSPKHQERVRSGRRSTVLFTRKMLHISNQDLKRYHLSLIRDPELAVIEEHLACCRDCLTRAEENLSGLREKERASIGHPSIDDLERYHRGQFDGEPTLVDIEEHLSDCWDCADRMLALDRFIHLVRTGGVKRPFE